MVTVVNATSSKYSGGTSETVTTPSGTISGDVILAVLTQNTAGTGSNEALPSGFTLSHSHFITSTVRPPVRIGYLRLTSAPAANYTFSTDAGTDGVCLLVSLRGVAGTGSPYRVGPTNPDNNDDETNIAPSITGTSGDLLMALYCAQHETAGVFGEYISTPSGMTLTHRSVRAEWSSLQICHQQLSSTGATGDKIATHERHSDHVAVQFTIMAGASATIQPSSLQLAVQIDKPTITGGVAVPTPYTFVPTPLFLDTIVDPELRKIIQSKKIRVNKQFMLLDHIDAEVDDITDRVVGCNIEHSNFRNIHRTIEIDIVHSLHWGYHRVKPYVQLDTPYGATDWYPLGVFMLTAPEEEVGNRPVIYHVAGFDKTYILDQKLANAVNAEAGQPVIWTGKQLLHSKGLLTHEISDEAGTELITTTRPWSIIEDITELTVVNTIFGLVNYRGVYMTPDGNPTTQKYIPPDDQQIVYEYSPLDPNTNVMAKRRRMNDFTNIPNRYIFWRANIEEAEIPTIGNGLYIFDNINDGPSSQIQRGNLVITHKEGLEVNSHAELEAMSQAKIKELMRSQTTINLQTTVNPLHGHFDIVQLNDPESGEFGKFQHMTWRMNLFSGLMDHELRSVETI